MGKGATWSSPGQEGRKGLEDMGNNRIAVLPLRLGSTALNRPPCSSRIHQGCAGGAWKDRHHPGWGRPWEKKKNTGRIGPRPLAPQAVSNQPLAFSTTSSERIGPWAQVHHHLRTPGSAQHLTDPFSAFRGVAELPRTRRVNPDRPTGAPLQAVGSVPLEATHPCQPRCSASPNREGISISSSSGCFNSNVGAADRGSLAQHPRQIAGTAFRCQGRAVGSSSTSTSWNREVGAGQVQARAQFPAE